MGTARRPMRGWRLLWRVGLVGALVMTAGVLALNLRLVTQLGRVDDAFAGLETRPTPSAGTTFLVVGTVTLTDAQTVAWLPGGPALESVMLVHLDADRRHARVDVLRLDDDLAGAITATSPARAVATVEQRTTTYVDHLVVLDMATLQELADRAGTGLTYLPGATAATQRDFVRAVLRDTLHVELRRQPWAVYATLDTVSQGAAVESGWSVLSMDRLVLSLRNLRSADIEFHVKMVP